MLEISANVMGKPSIIYPTLIWEGDDGILIDAGYPGQFSEIKGAIEKSGMPFDKLNMVILTHQDIDHIGSLSNIKKELNDVKVFAHEIEKPFIQGDKSPIKLAQLEANLDSLSDEMREVYKKIKAGFQSCKVSVDRTLNDGDKFPYCGGIEVVYTPGHTPGHICLYLEQHKLLIAGDALGVEGEKLMPSPAFINFDNALYLGSLKKLAHYDIETVLCYHGGLYSDNVNQRIKELAE